MKIAICEDDIKTQSLLESYLEEYPADLEVENFFFRGRTAGPYKRR